MLGSASSMQKEPRLDVADVSCGRDPLVEEILMFLARDHSAARSSGEAVVGVGIARLLPEEYRGAYGDRNPDLDRARLIADDLWL
jgi:hypothetical protein